MQHNYCLKPSFRAQITEPLYRQFSEHTEQKGRMRRTFVCQTWEGYNLHVIWWSSLRISLFWSFTKRGLTKIFQTWIYYCHACHTRFAIALLSSAIDLHDNCLRSLLNVNQNGNLSSQTLLLSVLYVDQLPTLSPLKKVKWFSVFVSL